MLQRLSRPGAGCRPKSRCLHAVGGQRHSAANSAPWLPLTEGSLSQRRPTRKSAVGVQQALLGTLPVLSFGCFDQHRETPLQKAGSQARIHPLRVVIPQRRQAGILGDWLAHLSPASMSSYSPCLFRWPVPLLDSTYGVVASFHRGALKCSYRWHKPQNGDRHAGGLRLLRFSPVFILSDDFPY